MAVKWGSKLKSGTEQALHTCPLFRAQVLPAMAPHHTVLGEALILSVLFSERGMSPGGRVERMRQTIRKAPRCLSHQRYRRTRLLKGKSQKPSLASDPYLSLHPQLGL